MLGYSRSNNGCMNNVMLLIKPLLVWFQIACARPRNGRSKTFLDVNLRNLNSHIGIQTIIRYVEYHMCPKDLEYVECNRRAYIAWLSHRQLGQCLFSMLLPIEDDVVGFTHDTLAEGTKNELNREKTYRIAANQPVVLSVRTAASRDTLHECGVLVSRSRHQYSQSQPMYDTYEESKSLSPISATPTHQ